MGVTLHKLQYKSQSVFVNAHIPNITYYVLCMILKY